MIRIGNKSIKTPANLRAIALPTEHGGWGFLLEPIVLGLLLAFTWQGLSFGLAMFALFLEHQPLKIAVKDRLKGIHNNRTLWAEGFAILYLSLAFLFSLPAFMTASPEFFITLALMIPFITLQSFYDFQSKSRELLPELAGAVALGASSTAILLLGEWQFIPALMIWLVLVARAIPAILFVRSIFRQQRGKDATLVLTYGAHVAAILLLTVLAYFDFLPYLSALAMFILLGRAYLALNSKTAIVPKVLGFREMAFGLMTVLMTWLGVVLGI